ncbi:hypothetical protein TNCV_1489171 [Trichonephila clavipes]|nr:hypothetical protein TNCV_1489171 [Trichonephila clavipes]
MPRIRCSRRKQFLPKLHAYSGTIAQTLKGSYLGKLPLWPTDPLYHCRNFRYGRKHKKSGCHSLEATRGLLATDHVIFNHGQVTRTTPELAFSDFRTTPTKRQASTDLTFVGLTLGWFFVALRLKTTTGQRWTRIRDYDPFATAG